MIYSLTNPKLENPALDNQKSDQVVFILKKKDKIKIKSFQAKYFTKRFSALQNCRYTVLNEDKVSGHFLVVKC